MNNNPFHAGPQATEAPEDIPGLHAAALELLRIIQRDSAEMNRAKDYVDGEQDDPYIPDLFTDEYMSLVERSKTNVMKLVVGAPTQQMYVDSFRTSVANQREHETSAWQHWQRSRLDARQHPLYRGAFTYGHAFTLTELRKGKAFTKTLSPRLTSAIFDDPANDIVPVYALTIVRRERRVTNADGTTKILPGFAWMWDATHVYEVGFEGFNDVTYVHPHGPHGASECPVTRFAVDVDLDGKTEGLVIPLIPLQNRINQTILDLLVAQSGGSYITRTVSGMTPPVLQKPVWQTDPDTGEYILDEAGQRIVDHFVDVIDSNGNPVAAPMNLNASRFLYAEDPETKFGWLPGTALDGYISAVDMAFRHLSILDQLPPDYVLGQIANLSAEALQSAERAMSRKVSELQTAFGEAWERVFRLAAELEGDMAIAQDFAAEVIWRDLDKASMSRVADALGKLKDVGVPTEGLLEMVPNQSQQTVERWKAQLDEGDHYGQLAAAIDAQRQQRTVTDGNTSTPTG